MLYVENNPSILDSFASRDAVKHGEPLVLVLRLRDHHVELLVLALVASWFSITPSLHYAPSIQNPYRLDLGGKGREGRG